MPRLIDLSHDLADGTVTYPGLPPLSTSTFLSRADSVGRYAEGTTFDIGMVTMCANTGTYLDTPFHRYADGHDLSGVPLERCAELRAVVLHVEGATAVPPSAFGDLDFEGCAVLVHTGWSRHWGTERYFSNEHPYLAAETVAVLIEGGAVLVGIDSLNIDSTVGGERPAHTGLLARGILIVEHLTNLDQLPPVGARFTAVPPKVAGLGTFTVRAFCTLPDGDGAQRPAICEVVIDCAAPASLAQFWSHVVGGVARVRSEAWATVRDPRPGGVLVAFQRVPEGKAVKNRVHLDVWSEDIAADTRRLVQQGATTVGSLQSDEAGTFQILLDPEGNEFCLVS